MRLVSIAAPAIATWLALGLPLAQGSSALPEPMPSFIDQYCVDCHDSDSKKGDFDLTSLDFNLNDPHLFTTWVKVYDRISSGEMPPKKEERPARHDLESAEQMLSKSLLH